MTRKLLDTVVTSAGNPVADMLSAFVLMLQTARDGIVLQDTDARIEWINPAAEAMFGWTLDEVLGHKPQEFVLPPDRRPSPEEISEFRYDLSGSIFGRYELTQHMRRDGSVFWNQQSFAVIALGPKPQQRKVVITCRDVTEQVDTERVLRQMQVDLERAANHDDLTGLANRKKLTEYLGSPRVLKHIAARDIGVLQVDIDKFKEINDTLGHAAGDATLCHVADALRACCGTHDLVCRTGGDEFLVICLKTATQQALMARAELLLRSIADPLNWKGQAIRLGSSIGAAIPSAETTDGEALIHQADQALYSAKSQGRGRVVFYTRHLGRFYKAQQKLVRELKTALAEKQFEIFLQPQLHLQGNRVKGCEALIRWRHPSRGILAPGAFLDAAEKAGLLADIDYRSMNMSLDALLQLHKAGFGDLSISINVSASILADVNYPGLLDWALQSRGIKPGQVCIEILETTILDGGDLDIVTTVERLKRLGVRVALDDFGTGYAGLAHMSTFEIDAIKLDRSMISRLESDPRNRVIIRAIIRLCSLLGMSTVAEGVETREQLDILRHARCPVIQGFGVARPMPVADMARWLRENPALDDPLSAAPAPPARAKGRP